MVGGKKKTPEPFDPFCTPIPKNAKSGTPSLAEDAEEQSKVTDMDSMFRKMEKLDRVLGRMAGPVSQIPEVRSKVDESLERVTRVEEQVSASKEKVAELDQRVSAESGKPHDCHQVAVIAEIKDSQREDSRKIEKDVQKGIELRGQVDHLASKVEDVDEEVDKFHGARRSFSMSMTGVAVTLLLAAGSAVYFFGGLSATVEANQRQNVEATKRLEKSVNQLSKRVQSSNRPVLEKVSTLAKQVERSNGHEEEFNRLCENMSGSEKRSISSTLMKRGKRIPRTCRGE